jgi:hypothetical protein
MLSTSTQRAFDLPSARVHTPERIGGGWIQKVDIPGLHGYRYGYSVVEGFDTANDGVSIGTPTEEGWARARAEAIQDIADIRASRDH